MSGARILTRNCDAISEVMGQVLMTGIAIIMLSGIAVTVFSQDGPVDSPKSNFQEWIDVKSDTLFLKHVGGDIVDVNELEIIVNINGNRYISSPSNISKSLNSTFWEMGEVIEINTQREWGFDLEKNDFVEVFLVDLPSKTLIQNFMSSSISTQRSPPVWISPMRVTEYKNSVGKKMDVRLVQEIGDNMNLSYSSPKKPTGNNHKEETEKKFENPSDYEEFEFGVYPEIYDFKPGDPISNVTLKVVYYLHDKSNLEMRLKVWDEYPNRQWRSYELPENKGVNTHLENLSGCINTTLDVENLKVQFVALDNSGSENDKKDIKIDFLAVKIV